MAHIEERETKRGTRYRAMVYIGLDPKTGRRKFTTKTFDTPEEANAWAAERELKRSRGTLTEPAKDTFAVYGRAWLRDAKDRLRPSTFHGYSETFRRYVEEPLDGAPQVGTLRMDRLRPEHVNQLYRWMMDERGLAKGTVKSLHAVIRQVLDYAYRSKAVEEPIAPLVKVPRVRTQRRKVKAMTEEELGRFLEAARTVRKGSEGERLPDRYYALWYTLQATGLRPGEALGLMWEDLDLETRTLRVRRALSRIPGEGWQLTDPKTSGSERAVKLPASAVPVLQEHRKDQVAERLAAGPEWQDHGLVFTTESGAPCDWTNLRRHFGRIMRRAGLGELKEPPTKPTGQPGPRKQGRFKPAFRPYDLRHTHATLSLKAGVPAKVISGRLGHHSAAFTMDVYTAWIPALQDDAADAWDEVLDQANEVNKR